MSNSTMTHSSQRMQCMEVWGGNQATSKFLEMTGLDVWVDCQPHRGAKNGGDVYYLSACASGRIARLMLADVSGHGEEVAHIAGDLRGLMRRYVNYISQVKFLQKLNTRFEPLASLGKFATGIALTFFGPSKQLTVCNFGHPTPLIYRNKTQAWSLFGEEAHASDHPRNLPLGVVESSNIQQCQIPLEDGDAVLCYTDGFSEARTPVGELVGSHGLLALANEYAIWPPQVLMTRLRNRLAEMRPENLGGDDSTLMLLQANGSCPSLKDNLLAPYRLLAGLIP